MFLSYEYATMHLGQWRNNVILAARICRDRYSLRRRLSTNPYRRMDRRIRETGNISTDTFYLDRDILRTDY